MAFDGLSIRFLTGSMELYGEAILAQVQAQARELVAGLEAAADIPVTIVAQPTVTTPDGIRRACLEASADDGCIGVIGWMHTFSPAKMWIAGLQALQKPFLHLHTQYGAQLPYGSIDMAFMNLNQSAHGDREFAYIVSRLRMPRKTSRATGRTRPCSGASAPGPAPPRVPTRRAGCGSSASATTCARWPTPTATRSSCRRASARPATPTRVNELAAVVAAVADAEVERLCAEYDETYAVVPALRAGGERRASLRDAARIELGLRAFLGELGSMAFVDTFQDLGGLKQLPGIGAQRLMADGYGFGAEGDWKSSALVRIVKAMSDGPARWRLLHGGLHLRLRRRPARCSGLTCWRSAPPSRRPRPPARSTPSSWASARTPCGSSSPPPPARASWSASSTWARTCGWWPTRSTRSSPPAELPALPVARALWVPRPDFATSAESWLLAGGPHHTVYIAGGRPRGHRGPRRDARRGVAGHRRRHRRASASARSCAGRRSIGTSPAGSEETSRRLNVGGG